MNSVTLRAKSVIKLTDGLMDLTWTFDAGTPRDIVLRDLSGGKYQKLQTENEQLQATNKQLLSALEKFVDTFQVIDKQNHDRPLPIDSQPPLVQMAMNAITNAKGE